MILKKGYIAFSNIQKIVHVYRRAIFVGVRQGTMMQTAYLLVTLLAL